MGRRFAVEKSPGTTLTFAFLSDHPFPAMAAALHADAAEEQKTKRYDRQIRIWGKSGQEKLEKAKVCLLGAGPT